MEYKKNQNRTTSLVNKMIIKMYKNKLNQDQLVK